MNIEDIFSDGSWLGDDYVICCPFDDCEDVGVSSHDHCYLNPEKGVWYCFMCNRGGRLKTFLRRFGNGEELESNRSPKPEPTPAPQLDLSEYPIVDGTKDSYDRLAYSYLQQRGFGSADIRALEFHYAKKGRYFGRILIPVYEKDEVVCAVARSFLHFVKPKYLYPRKGETKLTAHKALYGEFKTGAKGPVVLVEGVFDALKVAKYFWEDCTTIALLGKRLSDEQTEKILANTGRETIAVLLDSDAKKEALAVARTLKAYGRSVQIGFLPEGKDPADSSFEELQRTLVGARTYTPGLEAEVLLDENS